MVISLFKRLFGSSDPFTDFSSNAERLHAILSKMEQDAQSKNWRALQDKGEAALRIIGTVTGNNPQCLITLWQKQYNKIHHLQDSGEKQTIIARQELLKKMWRVLVVEISGVVETAKLLQHQRKHALGISLKHKILEAEKTLATMRATVNQQVQLYNQVKYTLSSQKKDSEKITFK